MIKIKFTNDVSETLLIPLYMKAMENNVKNPILKDEFSQKLYKEIDYDFSKFKKAKFSRIGTVIRSAYFDNVAKNFIKKFNNPIIVQLGAGLDTRYHRINGQKLNAIFYELDLPEVISLRKTLLPQGENNTYLAFSMFDDEWIELLRKKHPSSNFLFIIEGVLMYFDEEKVKKIIKKIAKNFKGELAFDVVSFWMSQNSSKHDIIKNTKAKFVYGIDNEKELEHWASNLQYLETKYYMNQYRYRWGIFGNIMGLIPKFANASKMLRYKIHNI